MSILYQRPLGEENSTTVTTTNTLSRTVGVKLTFSPDSLSVVNSSSRSGRNNRISINIDDNNNIKKERQKRKQQLERYGPPYVEEYLQQNVAAWIRSYFSFFRHHPSVCCSSGSRSSSSSSTDHSVTNTDSVTVANNDNNNISNSDRIENATGASCTVVEFEMQVNVVSAFKDPCRHGGENQSNQSSSSPSVVCGIFPTTINVTTTYTVSSSPSVMAMNHSRHCATTSSPILHIDSVISDNNRLLSQIIPVATRALLQEKRNHRSILRLVDLWLVSLQQPRQLQVKNSGQGLKPLQQQKEHNPVIAFIGFTLSYNDKNTNSTSIDREKYHTATGDVNPLDDTSLHLTMSERSAFETATQQFLHLMESFRFQTTDVRVVISSDQTTTSMMVQQQSWTARLPRVDLKLALLGVSLLDDDGLNRDDNDDDEVFRYEKSVLTSYEKSSGLFFDLLMKQLQQQQQHHHTNAFDNIQGYEVFSLKVRPPSLSTETEMHPLPFDEDLMMDSIMNNNMLLNDNNNTTTFVWDLSVPSILLALLAVSIVAFAHLMALRETTTTRREKLQRDDDDDDDDDDDYDDTSFQEDTEEDDPKS